MISLCFSLRLSSIGYEHLLFFLMCSFLACAYYFLVIHLTISFYLITTTTSFGLSLDTSTVGFSRDYIRMPVLTRSMMKRGLQPPPGSVGILTCPTCYTDGSINSSSPTDFPPKISSLSSVPELIDQCDISLSSSESDDSSVALGDEDSEISNFENFELSETSSPVHSCHNLSLNHVPKMESDCVDNSPPSIKVDGGSSNQDNIMQMLTIISTKMMDTIQDLQNQLATNDLKYTAELQKLSQENETFDRMFLLKYTVLTRTATMDLLALKYQLNLWSVRLQFRLILRRRVCRLQCQHS
jgi:hypothetical protein